MVYCHLTLLTDESLLVMHQQWMPLLESVPPSMAQTFTLSVKCNSRARMHLKHPPNIIYLILCQDGKHFFVQKIHCESFLPKIYFVRFVPAGQTKTEKGEFKKKLKIKIKNKEAVDLVCPTLEALVITTLLVHVFYMNNPQRAQRIGILHYLNTGFGTSKPG